MIYLIFKNNVIFVIFDFHTDLNFKRFRNTCIMVVCDRLIKIVHFVLLIGLPTADSAIQGLMESIFCIHRFPREIITDIISQFTIKIIYY